MNSTILILDSFHVYVKRVVCSNDCQYTRQVYVGHISDYRAINYSDYTAYRDEWCLAVCLIMIVTDDCTVCIDDYSMPLVCLLTLL